MGELVITSGTSAGTVYALPAEPVVIGRAPVCPIQLQDPWISSAHARIERRGDQLWVVDLESSNGTWIAEQRITEARLVPGRTLRFGKTAAEFREPARPAADVEATNLLNRPGTLFRPLSELNARMPEDRQLEIRIGINTGRVVAGNLGTENRLEFTVLGDTVNVASRLETLALPGTIFVGRSTYEKARDGFEFQALGTHQVKGRAAPIEVFRLTRPR